MKTKISQASLNVPEAVWSDSTLFASPSQYFGYLIS